MVTLGLGQAILGGLGIDYQNKIYHFTCYEQDCKISLLNQLLEVPRDNFVAIQIPDSISGCISDSKIECFHYLAVIMYLICSILKIRNIHYHLSKTMIFFIFNMVKMKNLDIS